MQQEIAATAVLAAGPVAGLVANAHDCCSALANAGIQNILYPGSDAYQDRTESYWSVSSQLTPWCIVQPTCTDEVSKAVTTLVEDTQCQFAVRSGGHMIWGGSNNIEDGVTLDLGLMNTTTFNEEEKTASIQPGTRWRGVYEALDPYGYTAPGGRAASVGVSGFLTGGGNSFYSAKMGFACDNVLNFEVVKANGEVINANENENSDLWRALKGGQSNFGIVTRFDMTAFEAPDLWGGVTMYPKSTGDQHIDAYVDWTNNVQNDVNGSSIVFWQYNPQVKDIVIIGAYDDVAGNVAPPSFDKFMAIPSNMSSTLRKASHLDLTNELEQPEGYRDIWWTGTIKNDRRVYQRIVELHEELCDNMLAQSPDGDFVTQAMFQSIPQIMVKHGAEKGGNMLGLERNDENVVMLLYTLAVNGEEQQKVAQEQMDWFSKETMDFAESVDAKVQWEYINYSYEGMDPLASYGAANNAHIRAMAAKYDPTGVFQTRAPGGFKISKSVPIDEL